MAENTLKTAVTALSGVGPTRAKALEKLGLRTLGDLLEYYPRDYEDRRVRQGIATLPEEEPVCFPAMVTETFHTAHVRRGMEVTKGQIVDETGQVEVTFFNQTYVRAALHPGETYLFYGKLTGAGRRRQLANPQFEPQGRDEMTGRIVPVYPLTAGLSNRMLSSLTRRAVECAGQREELLPKEVLERYHLAQVEFSYRNIHFPASWEDLELARQRLAFQELFCLAVGLALLRGRREEEGAIAFPPGGIEAFLRQLPFTLTGAQRRSLAEAAADLGRPAPMNRLLQGDVGSGKTVVAAGCIWLAWQARCQAALMAPTELLAQQHVRTLEQLLGGAGLTIGLLTGSMKATQKKQVLAALAEGTLDLVVGTHALLSEGVAFQRLGLVITDEQHRFGVHQRAALSAKAGETIRPHVLVMSATPIPRTLALMIYGDLDLSVIEELPPGRTPVATYVVGEDKRERIYRFVRKQVGLGRQVYIVCPAVSEEDSAGQKAAEQYGRQLQTQVFPDLRTAIVHGKRKGREKEAVMEAFAAGELDILVSTTVIEVGVDVSNASLMIVENADRFGLSQLHQLRGRVGRGQFASYCILVTDSRNPLSLQRLHTLADTNDGFAIAEADLKTRGPGDFFGARQHGLPQLKLATMEGDMKLLHQAQSAAREVLAQDPTLCRPEHAGLRRQIQALFQERGNGLN